MCLGNYIFAIAIIIKMNVLRVIIVTTLIKKK